MLRVGLRSCNAEEEDGGWHLLSAHLYSVLTAPGHRLRAQQVPGAVPGAPPGVAALAWVAEVGPVGRLYLFPGAALMKCHKLGG